MRVFHAEKSHSKVGETVRPVAQYRLIGRAFLDPVGNQFDGITVMSFANPNDLEDFTTSDAYEAVVEDENNFIAESEFLSFHFKTSTYGQRRCQMTN